jgi:hypothetical protein
MCLLQKPLSLYSAMHHVGCMALHHMVQGMAALNLTWFRARSQLRFTDHLYLPFKGDTLFFIDPFLNELHQTDYLFGLGPS